VIFVEVLDRRHQASARTRLSAFPATIGRAYENDVLLDDRYVDPVHARLVLQDDGTIVLEDTGSRNGIRDAATGDAIGSVAVRSGMVVRLGDTRLRLVEPGHPVPAALREPRVGNLALALRRPGLAWSVVLAGVLVLGVGGWLGSVGSEWATDLAVGVVAAMLLLALWAGAWAFASRVFTGHARFTAHFAVAVGTMTVVSLAGGLMGFVRFLWPGASLWPVLGFVATAAVLTVMFHSHLSLTGALGARARRLMAGAVALLLTAGVYTNVFDDLGGFGGGLDYDGNLSPVGASLAATVSLDELLDAATDVQVKVDSLASVKVGR
jgi:hypothetical protein